MQLAQNLGGPSKGKKKNICLSLVDLGGVEILNNHICLSMFHTIQEQ